MLNTLRADFQIIFDRDPAARNWLEVLLCYPGLQALMLHRFSHQLHRWHLPVIPRLLSHVARFITGIEIHPGATIGTGVFIDHGMGVVIGETAIVGDYCLIYQGVTLGGTGKECGKRHPTLGNNVVVGAGAKVLGNIEIGNDVRIGAGSVVLRTVPSGCTVVGVPGRAIYRSGSRVEPLEHGKLPDSEAQAIRALLDRIESLEQTVQDLRQHQTRVESLSTNTAVQLERELVAVSQQRQQCQSTPDVAFQWLPTTETTQSSQNQPGLGEAGKVPEQTSCPLNQRAITEFLDGAGI